MGGVGPRHVGDLVWQLGGAGGGRGGGGGGGAGGGGGGIPSSSAPASIAGFHRGVPSSAR